MCRIKDYMETSNQTSTKYDGEDDEFWVPDFTDKMYKVYIWHYYDADKKCLKMNFAQVNTMEDKCIQVFLRANMTKLMSEIYQIYLKQFCVHLYTTPPNYHGNLEIEKFIAKAYSICKN